MLLLLVTADTQREYEKIRVQARIACGVGGGEQVWASFDQEEEEKEEEEKEEEEKQEEEKEEEEKQEEEKQENSPVQVRRCHQMGEGTSATGCLPLPLFFKDVLDTFQGTMDSRG